LKHRFNLRVYALIIDENKRILLSDECRFGHFFTKFPGGGVEANEGVIDALRRELQEELSAEMLDSSFFYFNDFEQVSAFDPTQSLVAFYYLVQLKEPERLGVHVYPTPFQEETEKQRWMYISELHKEDLTFPIDQLVLGKLREMLIS
jgi:ADP-ribose pyrophosphatase YjhB (NUDIX family)